MRILYIFFIIAFFQQTINASAGEDSGSLVRVLSIQGDGMQALANIPILAKLEADSGRPLWEQFDVIAGNNMGGVIALALATGKFSASELFDLIKTVGDKGYKITKKRRFISTFGAKKYSTNKYKAALFELFDDLKLSDLKTGTIVPAFEDVANNHVVFSAGEAKLFDKDDYLLRDVAMATTSNSRFFNSLVLNSGGRKMKFSKNATQGFDQALRVFAESQKSFGPERQYEMVTVNVEGETPTSARIEGKDILASLLQERNFCFDVSLRAGCDSSTKFTNGLKYSGEDAIATYDFELMKLSQSMHQIAKIPDN